MKFKPIEFENSLNNIKLLYNANDYGFGMEPRIFYQDFVITINYLQLGLDTNMVISNISGLCPYQAWEKTDIKVPNHHKASIQVETDFDHLPGGGYKIDDKEWPQYINEKTGWYCVGDINKRKTSIEFIKNCVAVIEDDQIVALWLHPEN